ncbi:hypothetical protein Noda2021_04460 [Candidatus Dependentiae bacterium Noda2021]|nr:hypothetical protein Noda2021_04460 [Candidatus Dependentiae bacterium Noda2021]
MERDNRKVNTHDPLKQISYLPKKILSLQEADNLTEFVMHDLCHDHCFKITKAAYLVDNPDFNCLKGITGFSREESYPESQKIWEQPELFTEHMRTSPFNQHVRSLMLCSASKKSAISDQDMVHSLAENLGMKNHSYCTWNAKYDNHGLFLYEVASDCVIDKDHLLHGLCLLSFCPIY